VIRLKADARAWLLATRHILLSSGELEPGGLFVAKFYPPGENPRAAVDTALALMWNGKMSRSRSVYEYWARADGD
jgi:hypothetical protein